MCEESPDDKVEKKKSRTWKLMELLMEEPNAEGIYKVVVHERKKAGMKLPLDSVCKKDVAFSDP